jgi:hypothetical protein
MWKCNDPSKPLVHSCQQGQILPWSHALFSHGTFSSFSSQLPVPPHGCLAVLYQSSHSTQHPKETTLQWSGTSPGPPWWLTQPPCCIWSDLNIHPSWSSFFPRFSCPDFPTCSALAFPSRDCQPSIVCYPRAWRHLSVILAPGRLRQEDFEFEATGLQSKTLSQRINKISLQTIHISLQPELDCVKLILPCKFYSFSSSCSSMHHCGLNHEPVYQAFPTPLASTPECTST